MLAPWVPFSLASTSKACLWRQTDRVLRRKPDPYHIIPLCYVKQVLSGVVREEMGNERWYPNDEWATLLQLRTQLYAELSTVWFSPNNRIPLGSQDPILNPYTSSSGLPRLCSVCDQAKWTLSLSWWQGPADNHFLLLPNVYQSSQMGPQSRLGVEGHNQWKLIF